MSSGEGWPGEEPDPSEAPTIEMEAVKPEPLPPVRKNAGWWDADWAWTLVALLVWAFLCGAVKMPSAVALIGAVAIVFTWRKRRPWYRRGDRPPWRGWPGL